MMISKRNNINGVEIQTLENDYLKTEFVPALGGKRSGRGKVGADFYSPDPQGGVSYLKKCLS